MNTFHSSTNLNSNNTLNGNNNVNKNNRKQSTLYKTLMQHAKLNLKISNISKNKLSTNNSNSNNYNNKSNNNTKNNNNLQLNLDEIKLNIEENNTLNTLSTADASTKNQMNQQQINYHSNNNNSNFNTESNKSNQQQNSINQAKANDKIISSNSNQSNNLTNYFYLPQNYSLEIIQEQDTPYSMTPKTNKKSDQNKNKILNINNNNTNTNSKSLPVLNNLPNKNSQIPYEYLPDIFNNLLTEEKENNFNNKNNYGKQRAILINWLLDVSIKFNLLSETFFLTINILDNYLKNIEELDMDKLQLLGASSLSIACKYEEIYSPEIRDFVYITESNYTKEEILQCESNILKSLDYKVTYPSVYKYLQILEIYYDLNNKEKNTGMYLLELFIIHNRFNSYYPSIVSFAIIAIILKIRNSKVEDNGINLNESNCFKSPQNKRVLTTKNNNSSSSNNKTSYLIKSLEDKFPIYKEEKNEIKACCLDILFVSKYISSSGLSIAFNKYQKSKYDSVSNIDYTKIIL